MNSKLAWILRPYIQLAKAKVPSLTNFSIYQLWMCQWLTVTFYALVVLFNIVISKPNLCIFEKIKLYVKRSP